MVAATGLQNLDTRGEGRMSEGKNVELKSDERVRHDCFIPEACASSEAKLCVSTIKRWPMGEQYGHSYETWIFSDFPSIIQRKQLWQNNEVDAIRVHEAIVANLAKTLRRQPERTFIRGRQVSIETVKEMTKEIDELKDLITGERQTAKYTFMRIVRLSENTKTVYGQDICDTARRALALMPRDVNELYK